MPLIKADQSVPLFKDAIVLNMNDVSVQAEQIKASAKKTAEALIEQAKAKAQKVTDDHASEGYERGYADGFKKGQTDGFDQGKKRGLKEGHSEAVNEARQQFQPLVASWEDAGKAWDDYHNQLDMDARDSVIELALRLAEKIIHRQLLVDANVIVDQVTAALKSLTGATNLSIHINPEDRPAMSEVMPELLETFSQFKHMRVVDDANIGKGGCILIHEHGRLDASIETQLRRAVELLLPGDMDVESHPVVEDEPQAPAVEHIVDVQMSDSVDMPENMDQIDEATLVADDPLSAILDQVDDILKSSDDTPEQPQA